MKTNRGWVVLAGFFGFMALVVLWGISVSNQLVRLDESVKSSWAQVENVYQRRMDLIPNLVNTVKGYAAHEKETLESVVQARAAATNPGVAAGQLPDGSGLKKFQQAQDGLSSALSRLMVVVEKYPELKANENFRDLQAQLEGTENRIAVERQRFNATAQELNTALRVFPGSLVARFQGYQPRAYFEAAAEAKKAPQVQF